MRTHKWLASAAVVLAAALASAAPAHAARLVKVDEKFVKEVPPEPGVIGSDPCTGSFSFFLNGDTDGRTARARLGSSSQVQGTEAECSLSISITLTGTLAYQLVPDAGELPGQPVPLCVHARHDAGATSSPPYNALANTGGDPFTDPATVTLFPGATVVLSDGPIAIINNGQNSDNQVDQVTANIGDIVELRVGTRTLTQGLGVGSASARANQELFVSVGSCARSGAPAASSGVLVVIALTLGGLGALTLAWRRPRA